MYGLFLRALQGYVTATFGGAQWSDVLAQAGVAGRGFEPLISYRIGLFRDVIRAAGQVLDRPQDMILEDMGTHIVANPVQPALRRLLRFGGSTFAEFLLSLEELPERARLALPDIDFPRLELSEAGPGEFRLTCRTEAPELAHVMLGVLRAMADDYGALVIIDGARARMGQAVLSIRLLEARFAAGNRFDLAQSGPGHA
ncbi:heme NO-binding domain-containing protein [Neotabrizicola sp. VNH66]|uniref:heme NO-binding domain-containing protein n=1 Tax=Neotabrizicola sp. VNH66 TaxID=3400918 RepID=UPI003BFDDB92